MYKCVGTRGLCDNFVPFHVLVELDVLVCDVLRQFCSFNILAELNVLAHEILRQFCSFYVVVELDVMACEVSRQFCSLSGLVTTSFPFICGGARCVAARGFVIILIPLTLWWS